MQLIREIQEEYIISNSSDVYKYLKEFINEDREYFIVLGLDSKNKVLYREIVSIGTLNSGLVHARETFKKAIIMSCNAIIIAHNHPSGDPTPSDEDVRVKNKIEEAGEVLGIKVLDCIIIGKDSYERIK